ncbi:MAG: hypothetical protein AAB582_02410 [Patescibacteria group bacterium]
MTKLIGIGVLALIVVAVLVVMIPPAREEVVEEVVVEQPVLGRDALVETYIKEHISELSTEAEVLGGTYYVTSVHAENGTGTVSYEDGHVAYTADFTYIHVKDSGNISISSFVIRE